MRTACPGRAEVVDVLHLADDREDDVVGHLRRAARAVPATRPSIAARKRNRRAVVRWRLI
jgi:hypothetical protein